MIDKQLIPDYIFESSWEVCNKVAVMEKGQIIEQGGLLDVFGEPKEETTKTDFFALYKQGDKCQYTSSIIEAEEILQKIKEGK